MSVHQPIRTPARDFVRRTPAWAPPLFALLCVVALRPIGYAGFGDEPHYLAAARCAAEHGFCLPETHWAARFPLVAPVGWTFALLGESRAAAMLAPLLYAAAAVLLLVANVRRRFGREAAMIAGVVLAITPAFGSRALIMSADVAELCWVLAAVLAWQIAVEGGRMRTTVLAGIMLGLAVVSRQTALAVVAVLAAGTPLLPRPHRRLAVATGTGFAALLTVEAATYLTSSGDALLGWRLSLGHTRIPSTELSGAVDLSASPLFNPDFIGGWRPHAGVEAHWSVVGLVNLLASPESGLTLAGAALLGWTAWPSLTRERRWVALLGAAAALHFAILTYALAIHPTSRMFLAEVAIAATVIGVAATRRWRHGSRALIAAVALLLAVRGVLAPYEMRDLRAAGPIAAAWARDAAGPVALDGVLATTLALSPEVAHLSRDENRATTVIALAAERCDAARSARPGWRLTRRAVVPEPVPSVAALLSPPREAALLCLFSRPGREPRSPA